MKPYKLKRLIYFFLYKLNRWFGGKTKWEYSDERYYPPFPPSHFNCRCAVYPSVLEDWIYNSKPGEKMDLGVIVRDKTKWHWFSSIS